MHSNADICQENEMIETTSSLTFVPSKDDHNLTIECSAINDVMSENISASAELDIYCKVRFKVF